MKTQTVAAVLILSRATLAKRQRLQGTPPQASKAPERSHASAATRGSPMAALAKLASQGVTLYTAGTPNGGPGGRQAAAAAAARPVPARLPPRPPLPLPTLAPTALQGGRRPSAWKSWACRCAMKPRSARRLGEATPVARSPRACRPYPHPNRAHLGSAVQRAQAGPVQGGAEGAVVPGDQPQRPHPSHR